MVVTTPISGGPGAKVGWVPKEKYRNWQIWESGTEAQKNLKYAGSMRLDYVIPNGDKPDLIATIDEAMFSKLAAFQSKIVAGPKPPSTTPCAKPSIVRAKPTINHG